MKKNVLKKIIFLIGALFLFLSAGPYAYASCEMPETGGDFVGGGNVSPEKGDGVVKVLSINEPWGIAVLKIATKTLVGGAEKIEQEILKKAASTGAKTVGYLADAGGVVLNIFWPTGTSVTDGNYVGIENPTLDWIGAIYKYTPTGFADLEVTLTGPATYYVAWDGANAQSCWARSGSSPMDMYVKDAEFYKYLDGAVFQTKPGNFKGNAPVKGMVKFTDMPVGTYYYNLTCYTPPSGNWFTRFIDQWLVWFPDSSGNYDGFIHFFNIKVNIVPPSSFKEKEIGHYECENGACVCKSGVDKPDQCTVDSDCKCTVVEAGLTASPKFTTIFNTSSVLTWWANCFSATKSVASAVPKSDVWAGDKKVSGKQNIEQKLSAVYYLQWTDIAGSVINRNISVPMFPQGNFDEVNNDARTIRGWAYDPDTSDKPVNVELYVDNPKTATTAPAKTFLASGKVRTDLKTAFPDFFKDLPDSSLNHGFENVPLPPSVCADGGSHDIYLYPVDTTSGKADINNQLNNSPQKVFCQATPPPAYHCDAATNACVSGSGPVSCGGTGDTVTCRPKPNDPFVDIRVQ